MKLLTDWDALSEEIIDRVVLWGRDKGEHAPVKAPSQGHVAAAPNVFRPIDAVVALLLSPFRYQRRD